MNSKLTNFIKKYTNIQQAMERRNNGVETPEDFFLLLKESEAVEILQRQSRISHDYSLVTERWKDYLSKN